MRNFLLLFALLLTGFGLGRAFFYNENDMVELKFAANFGILGTDKDSNQFPNKFILNFGTNDEKFEINFTKNSKKYPDIYIIDKEGNTIKYGLKNAEEFEHFVDFTGEAHATLIKNNLNSTDSFRLIAKLASKNEPNITIEIYPVKISNRRKRNAVKTNEFYHAFLKRSSNDQFNTHAYINMLDARDYIIEKSELKINNKPKNKQARIEDGPVIYNVETLIVTDSSVFEDHKRISRSTDKDLVFNQMRIYFSHLMHSVDQKYQNSFKNDLQMKINILLTNFLFLTDPLETTWADSSITGDPQYPTYDGKEVIVASSALNNFKDYMESKTFPFTYDHAMALLKKDLWGQPNSGPETRKGIAGLAYLNGICTSIRYSISEENGGFSSIYTIAHELGHNLGSVHDGETGAEACPLTDYFIMTPVQNFGKIQNMQRFSSCSVAQFKSLLISEGSTTDYSQCLINTPLDVPQEFSQANFSLTGQIYGLNEQCRMLNGDNSSFCHFLSDNICSQLFCRKSNNEETCYASSPAVEGTTCGSGKACIMGECTSSSLVSASVCPFGDELVQTGTLGITLPSRYVSCPEFISILANNGNSEAAFCSSNLGQTSCCFTCLKYKYADCNDKYSNCGDFKDVCETANFASGAVKDECCATCQTRPVTCASSSDICLNGGTCLNLINVNNLLGYRCECPDGFSGYNCEAPFFITLESISTDSKTIEATTRFSSTPKAETTSTESTTIEATTRSSSTPKAETTSTESTTIEATTRSSSTPKAETTSTESTTIEATARSSSTPKAETTSTESTTIDVTTRSSSTQSSTMKSSIIYSITQTSSDNPERSTTASPTKTFIDEIITFIISIFSSFLRNLVFLFF